MSWLLAKRNKKSKSILISQHEAAYILASRTGMVGRGWVFELQDNRRGRALNELGMIPYWRSARGFILYKRTDIERVARVISLDIVTRCGLIKVFSS